MFRFGVSSVNMLENSRTRPARRFAVVWLSTLIGGLGIGMVSPLLPVFSQEMGATGIWLALAFSGFAISETPLMPFMGRLSDRFGRKLFMALGMLTYALAALGYVYAPTYQLLVLFRIFSGVGAAMFFPVSFAYVGDLSPPGKEGRYMGLFNVAFLLGWGAGPIIGGSIKDALGTDATFWSMMLMSSLAFVLLMVLLPRGRGGEYKVGPSKKDTPWLQLLKDGKLMAACSFEMIWGLSFGAVLSFLPVFMTTNLGTTATAIGLVISSRALLNGVLVYPYGRLADRMNRVPLVIAGAAVTAAGTLAIPWMHSFASLLVLFCITALFESVAVPAGTAIAVDRGRKLGMGSVMGLFNMAMAIGLLFGSLAGGLVQSSLGVENVFRYAAAVTVVGIAVFYTLMRRAQRGETAVSA